MPIALLALAGVVIGGALVGCNKGGGETPDSNADANEPELPPHHWSWMRLSDDELLTGAAVVEVWESLTTNEQWSDRTLFKIGAVTDSGFLLHIELYPGPGSTLQDLNGSYDLWDVRTNNAVFEQPSDEQIYYSGFNARCGGTVTLNLSPDGTLEGTFELELLHEENYDTGESLPVRGEFGGEWGVHCVATYGRDDDPSWRVDPNLETEFCSKFVPALLDE